MPPDPAPRGRRFLDELGLVSLYRSSRDIKLLCIQRFVRLFAYGASTLILVAFLQALGHSRTQSGLFMTLTLVGDVVISFVLTIVADAVGRRVILAAGAALMAGSGVVFFLFSNYWILLAAAIFGVISPSGNEIGPFRAVEESIVAQLTAPEMRGDIYAWYSLVGNAGTALGMMACGWATHFLSQRDGWDLLRAYRYVFVAYAVMGVLKLVLALCLSWDVEADTSKSSSSTEASPLLNSDQPERESRDSMQPRRHFKGLLPEISREGRGIATTLCLLFGLDAFASGLVPLSWTTYYFRSRYGIEEGRLGSIFFTTSLIAAASVLVASSLAKRLGNVKTMVFTHLPSSIFLALIPLPNSVYLSLLFLILRACSQSMDVAPRTAFLASILLPSERTAIMGSVNVVKTIFQSMGPLITGLLANHKLFWLSFVSAGALKASYDLGLLAVFKNHEKDRAEREQTRDAEDG